MMNSSYPLLHAMISVRVRTFTGRITPLDVDPASTVSDVKDIIAQRGLCRVAKPGLMHNEHELHDHRQILYYPIKDRDIIHIYEPMFTSEYVREGY